MNKLELKQMIKECYTELIKELNITNANQSDFIPEYFLDYLVPDSFRLKQFDEVQKFKYKLYVPIDGLSSEQDLRSWFKDNGLSSKYAGADKQYTKITIKLFPLKKVYKGEKCWDVDIIGEIGKDI
ncbi:MAG: hypothetical protein M0R17_08420 [Candidatus Omnitrophica bacterium]|jgi:hypothetical protein|nr:hypothetical protein [Candidatus Omnitrophota bacterium]